MRYFWLTLGLVAALAGGCWYVFFNAACDPRLHAAAETGDVMAWMRCEFRLTAAQSAAIARLHEEHGGACAVHCAAVGAARERLQAARRAGDAAAIAAAEQEEQAAAATCRASTEAHVRRVAALMSPEQGERYLRMVLPRLADLDHRGPPKLSLER